MTLPALLLAAAFALGIAWLGPLPAAPNQWLVLALTTLAGAAALLLRRMNFLALAFGLTAWVFLGALAVSCERAAVPENHVTSLVATGQIETSEPLRWRGTLRSDPLRLPWGYRYEIALDEVDVAGQAVSITGGMRVSYFLNERRPELIPALRAGDRVEALLRARPPRNFGNPGAFDVRTYLARQDVHLSGSLRSIELLQTLQAPPLTFAHRAARLRGALLDKLDELFASSPQHAAILRAMLLGDRSFLDHELADVFQKTAVYHVLVISGMHVAALVAFLVWCGRRLRMSWWLITLLCLLMLFAFVAIVEDQPPILRAALMATVVLCATLLFRRIALLNAVGIAALLILLARPSALVDPSFQLSFLAAGMIGALALPWLDGTSTPYRRALAHVGDVTRDAAHPPRPAQLRLDLRAISGWLAARFPSGLAARASLLAAAPVSAALFLWEVFVISSAIQLGMLPVLAWYFHRVSLAGPLANIPGAVLSALLIPLGYITLLAGAIWTGLGQFLAGFVQAIVAALVGSVEWFSRWTWGSYRIPAPPLWLLVAFFVSLTLLAIAATRERKWQWLFAVTTAGFAVCVAVHPFSPRFEAGRLEITVLDVGQGDSLFVAFPNGRTLLIDGGGSYGASRAGGFRTGLNIGDQVVSPYLWRRGLKRLDAVALTHAHQDHLDGLSAVMENFRVSELWIGREVGLPAFEKLTATARAHGVRIVDRRRGEHFDWGGVSGLVLWPEETQRAETASNNDSLVLRLEFGKTSFLLPGDIERQVEAELAQREDPLDVDFLKVPHHGSRTSATREFVQMVSPLSAAISVGDANPFGHPHKEVLDGMQAPAVRLLRTDRDGAITALSDGRTVRVTSFLTR